MLAGNDVKAISPLGGAEGDSYLRIWKNDLDFVIVFSGNYTCIIHHFREIEVFLLAGNDVIALSPLGGAVDESTLRILID